MERKKQPLPGHVIGLYVCMGVMMLLFLMSIVGIAIGGQDGTRPFFLMCALICAVMVLALALCAKWAKEKAAAQKKKGFASYAFEGEFAPQKKVILPEQKDPKRNRTGR